LSGRGFQATLVQLPHAVHVALRQLVRTLADRPIAQRTCHRVAGKSC